MILLGKPVADARRAQLASRVQEFKKMHHRSPRLDVVLVGADPASEVYVSIKHKTAQELGIDSVVHKISPEELVKVGNASAQQEFVAAKISALNAATEVDGILLQMPLPAGLKSDPLIDLIDPMKDVDGLSSWSMGELLKNQAKVHSCTPWGVLQMLKFYNVPLKGKKAVVIGRSLIVGKPMAQILLNEDMSVLQVHSKSEDIKEITKMGDVVIVAAGKQEFFGKDYFSPKSFVVDVGIHRLPGKKLVGDVKFDEVKDFVQGISPVPGGVGPLTIISLMENTMQLAELRSELV